MEEKEENQLKQVTDIESNPYKADFPLLGQNQDLSFLDSAATAQRPASVLEAQTQFYQEMNANPLRGLYGLSVEATQAIQKTREHIARHIGADDPDEIIFTRNTSESLNLIASSLSQITLGPGNEVVVSIMEHHSNILPWQQACKRQGARLVWLYPDRAGHLSQETIHKTIGPRCKIVSVTQVSNVLGCELPVKKIAQRAHEVGAYCIVDAAQSMAHMQVDVKDLECDALAFSAHKVFGPMGVGVLWAKREILEAMPPFLVGGEMITSVTQDGAVWAPIPEKFEAGTQDAAGIFATDTALTYMENLDEQAIRLREERLTQYLMDQLKALGFVKILGDPEASGHKGVVSFNVEGIHPHDVASILDANNVAIRAGHHCAEPLLTWLGEDSCCRASISFYNDKHDIDQLIAGLQQVWSIFNGTR